MPISSRITRSQAFTRFRDMGNDRSINGLFKILKDEGVRVGRQSLMTWQKEDRWNEQVSNSEATEKRIAKESAIIARVSRELEPLSDAEKIESTLETLAGLTKGLATICLAQLAAYSKEQALSMDEMMQLARTSAEVGKTIATVATALQKAAPAPDLLPPVNAPGAPAERFPNVDEALNALANPRK